MANRTFEYKEIPIDEIGIELRDLKDLSAEDKQIAQGSKYLFGSKMIRNVIIDGEPFKPTARFWNSLYARFGLNRSFFKFFGHEEVFRRIAKSESNKMVRVCIERSAGGNSVLLAATGLNKPIVIYDDLLEILNQYRLEGKIGYNNGVITSTHTPRIGASEFKIGGDKFTNKFVLHTPIDGYGTPNFFLSLLRLVCSNGAIGWANAFKTTLQLGTGGDSVHYTLKRALEGFTNDEGFAQMRSRFETAQQSWASLREQQDLYKLLIRLQNDKELRQGKGFEQFAGGRLASTKKEDWMKGHGAALVKAFTTMTGDPLELYFKDPNALGLKRQRALPVGCRVYDMINFATEVATHHVSEGSSRILHAWVGEMLSNEYDLEGSCDRFDEFRDFFVGRTEAKETIRQQQLEDGYQ